MYFSLIRLRSGLSPRDIRSLDWNDGYSLHQLIWNLFGNDADRSRDFLYRFVQGRDLPQFYAVSNRQPIDTANKWDIQTKQYDPKLKNGDRLSFMVCVNPVKSTRDQNNRQHRHDVVMDAKKAIGFKAMATTEKPLLAEIIQEAGVSWLKDRESDYGFLIDAGNAKADGYYQHKFFKKKGAHQISISTLELSGVLTVSDAVIFTEKCLYKGLGPAKGFGCGLMMVKRF